MRYKQYRRTSTLGRIVFCIQDRLCFKVGTHQETSCRDLLQGLALGTSPLVCTHILRQNSSRRDDIFGPCDQSHELSYRQLDFWDQSQGPIVPEISQFSSVYVAGQIKLQVNLFQPRSICFNLGQFVSTQVSLLQPRSI